MAGTKSAKLDTGMKIMGASLSTASEQCFPSIVAQTIQIPANLCVHNCPNSYHVDAK
jgi:hypothetical protein